MTVAAQDLDRDAATVLAAAKLWLVSTESPTTCGDLPYLASALYALIPVPSGRVTTMTTDEHWRLYVNTRWVRSTDIEIVAARMAHLVWHVLADHGARARDLDVGTDTAEGWRRAADATVAEALESARLPHGLLLPSGHGWDPGRSAEQYYAQSTRLPARTPRPDDNGSDEDGRASTSEPDGTCGSACDGHARSYDLPPGDLVGSVDQHDADALRHRVAIEWRTHVGSSPGTISGEWGRWVEQILEPRVPWPRVLAAAVRRGLGWAHGHSDYTYARISRRQAVSRSVVLPALRRPVPEVAVVVDTSGSVDDGLLAQALGEIDGILASQGVNEGSVTVLAVDAAIQRVERVRRGRDVRLGGGGGTDMGVGIDAALVLHPRPHLIVVLTDGFTPWPQHPPPVPVVATLIGRSRVQLPATPEWITRVECTPT